MSDSLDAAPASETADREVLRRRGEGQAYARISRHMGFDRSADAQRAFVRALGRLPAPEADRIRAEETSRLDRLAEQIRGDAERNDIDRARRLATIERLRTRINPTT